MDWLVYLKNIDPFQYNIIPVLEFLGQPFQAEYKYIKICLYSSVISPYHHLKEGLKVGYRPKVSDFIKGVLNAKPQPKYTTIAWDVKIGLHIIRINWGDNKTIFNKD